MTTTTQAVDVNCRRCFQVIPAAQIDPSLGFVECRVCNSVFELRPPGEPPPVREQVAMPRGVQIHRSDGAASSPYRDEGGRGALEVSLPFTRWRGVIGVLAGVFFIGVAIALLVVRPDDDGKGRYVAVAVALVSAAAVLYPGIAYVLNRRVLRIDGDVIEIQNKPVPWPSGRRIAVRGLKQLYVEHVTYRTQHGSDERFMLKAIDADGIHSLLITLDKANQALWLEQEIERHLGITDVPVLPRPD